MTVYCERLGDGPELVLVHGWGLHGGIWDSLPAQLARRFRVTVVDLPGHGRSPAPAAGTLAGFVAQLAALVERPAMWLGWSLGGLLALEVARQQPERVTRLALVASTPKFVQSADWPHGMPEPVFAEFARSLEQDYRATLLRFLSLHGGSNDDARAQLRALRAELFRHGEPSRAALAAGLAILRDTDLRAALGAIRVPALVLQGTHDRITPPAAGAYLAAQLPQARLESLRGAGHAPFLGDPAAFLAAVEGFCA
jgi:pimeloyl-[acyl-carrier protein] methyl ester esterase